MITANKNKRRGIQTFIETISEQEMDRRLEAQHDEVVSMLAEARAQREQREFAPLEPLYVFLKEARENFEASEGQSIETRA